MEGRRRLHNHLGSSELYLWETVTIPPRSWLYHMAPIGIGTGLVESATGYSSRLALAHNVTLAVLFGYEIAPLLNKNYLRNSEARSNKNAVLSNSFRSLTPAVDGHGIIAGTYITSLQKLTMRDDLHFLTMLPWKGVISHRHLTRPKRAWCPACYYEWRANGTAVYEPLAWSLAVVTVCSRHRQPLWSRCHFCQRELHHLASRSRPGYCAMCHAWLGEPAEKRSLPEEMTANELEWQSWVNEQTHKLLSTARTLTQLPRRSTMAESISRCIRASEFKTELAFAWACGLSQSAVNDLCRGACVPQLSTLLKISLVAKVSIVDLILGRTFEAEVETIPHRPGNNRLPKAKVATKVTALMRHRMASRPKNVARSFKRILQARPPMPMVEIEKRLDTNRRILSSRFPDLYREAAIRYRAHTEKCRQEFWEGVRGMLEKQLTEKAPLSVAKVARAVGRSREAVVRQFPKLYVRLCAYRVEQGKERWEAIETFLRNSLGSTPPLRLRDIATQLGLSHTSLYAHFPQLCHLIAERYECHFRQRRALKRESLRDEVRRIAKSLNERGIYPSVREVAKYLLRPIYLRSSNVALAALRDVRRELGLSFKGEILAGGTSK
jgi:hypothetical protein